MLTMRMLFFLLLFWITDAEIKVKVKSSKIEYDCNGNSTDIPYEELAEERTCGQEKIFIRLRPCTNCIEMDSWAIIGLTMGNLTATTLIGVAVYLVVSKSTTPSPTAKSQNSDRKPPIHGSTVPRGTDRTYQELHPRNQKDLYDQLR